MRPQPLSLIWWTLSSKCPSILFQEKLSRIFKSCFTLDLLSSSFATNKEMIVKSINTQALRLHALTLPGENDRKVQLDEKQQHLSKIPHQLSRLSSEAWVTRQSWSFLTALTFVKSTLPSKMAEEKAFSLQPLLSYQTNVIFFSNDLMFNYNLVWKDQYLLEVTNSLWYFSCIWLWETQVSFNYLFYICIHS